MTHRAGFTLLEIMMTVVIVSILSSAAVPQYLKTVRRARGLACRDILLTTFSGEQTFYAINDAYVQITQANRMTDALWRSIFMDNPNRNAPTGFELYVPAITPRLPDPPGPTFLARVDAPGAAPFMTITQTGQVTCGAGAPGTDPNLGCYP